MTYKKTLPFIVWLLLTAAQPVHAESLRLETRALRLVVDAQTGHLAEFTDPASGRNLVDPQPPDALWSIELPNAAPLTPAVAATVDVHRPGEDGAAAASITWRGFPGMPAARVVVDITLDGTQPESRWRLRTEGFDAMRPIQIQFPRIARIAPSDSETLAVPIWMGQSTTHARQLVNGPGRRMEWEYPGILSLQCLALYGRDTGGLYIAADDTGGLAKRLAVFGDGAGALGVELTQIIASGGAAQAGDAQAAGDYAMPYTATLGLLHGDWMTAAARYRQWALDQPWARAARLHAGSTTPWAADTGIWMWNRGRSENVLAPGAALAEAAGMPVSVLWHWWHGCPYDIGFPEYLPPREGAEPFQAALKQAGAAGVNAIVYMNQRLWGMTTASWKEQNAERHAVKGPDGAIAPEVYNIFTNAPCASMCMGTPFWRTTYAGIAQQAIALGVGGIYMDQACSSLACYDAAHGHPIGGGGYWMQGFRALEEDIRRRAGKPVALAGEGCGELWLPHLDLMLSLQVSMERYAAPGDWEPIPFFHAVYHGYGVFFGNYSSLTMPPYDELWPKEYAPEEPLKLLDRKFSTQFKLEQARAFVWGQQPSIANFRPQQLTERKDELDFFLALARAHRRHPEYFLRGTWLRPPRFDAPTAEIDVSRLSIYAGRKENLKEYRRVYPLVFASAWRSAEGNTAIALVSIAPEPATLQFTLPPEWALPANAAWSRVDGETHTPVDIGAPITLAPSSVCVLANTR